MQRATYGLPVFAETSIAVLQHDSITPWTPLCSSKGAADASLTRTKPPSRPALYIADQFTKLGEELQVCAF